MKKPIFVWTILFYGTSICHGGTAGPSDDEIFLLIIPVILFILYLGTPHLVNFLKRKITEWKEIEHLTNHENGVIG